jgi:hypothetical protein
VSAKPVVILGSGTGGTLTANRLRRQPGSAPRHVGGCHPGRVGGDDDNEKRVGRLNTIRHVLSRLPYDTKDESAAGVPRRDFVAPVRLLLPNIVHERPRGR